jgi:hypothetical protein
MNDWLYILLSVWGLLSFVSVVIAGLENFVEEKHLTDTYVRCIRYAIDNRKKFTPIGRLVIIPVWTLVGGLLPVPAMVVVGPVYLLGWVIYQSSRLLFFK